jgi:hypothetical protein
MIWQRSRSQPAPEAAPAPPSPAGQATATPQAPLVIPAPPAIDLEHSDDMFREKAKALSTLPKFADWLKTEDLVRRLTAAVDCIADGTSPRDSLEFLSPRKKFAVRKVNGALFIDPRSYARYDLVAAVLDSVDAQAAAALVKDLRPYFKAASRELGVPDRDFQSTLVKAIKEMLKTPVVERAIPLREKVISFSIAPLPDLQLEDLTAAQKHLLRMGPKNTRKIQNKLRDIALALGAPADQLPQQKIYTQK